MSQDSPPQQPVTAEVVTAQPVQTPPQPPQVVIKNSGTSRFWSWLGWTGFFLCFMALMSMLMQKKEYFDTTDGIQEKFHSGDTSSNTKIAIITVSGAIGSGDGYVKNQIDRVRDDEDVEGIILRVDSPGGTVSGSDYIYHHLKRLREDRDLPIVVSMGGMAASGGYYVSMAVGDLEDSIFAEPTTITGSIGVIIPHYDVSGLMNEYGVKDDSIVTHPRKQMLSMTRPIPDEHRAILQDQVDETLERFVSIVKSGRPELRDGEGLMQGETNLATGEIFSAERAVQFGLVDKIGFIEDAIQRLCKVQGLDPEEVRVVEFSPPPSLFNLSAMKAQRGAGPATLLEALEKTAPQAYFMCSWAPPVITTSQFGKQD